MSTNKQHHHHHGYNLGYFGDFWDILGILENLCIAGGAAGGGVVLEVEEKGEHLSDLDYLIDFWSKNHRLSISIFRVN